MAAGPSLNDRAPEVAAPSAARAGPTRGLNPWRHPTLIGHETQTGSFARGPGPDAPTVGAPPALSCAFYRRIRDKSLSLPLKAGGPRPRRRSLMPAPRRPRGCGIGTTSPSSSASFGGGVSSAWSKPRTGRAAQVDPSRPDRARRRVARSNARPAPRTSRGSPPTPARTWDQTSATRLEGRPRRHEGGRGGHGTGRAARARRSSLPFGVNGRASSQT
jgi:hypothetical protein